MKTSRTDLKNQNKHLVIEKKQHERWRYIYRKIWIRVVSIVGEAFEWERRISGNGKEKKTEMKGGKNEEKIWTLYKNLKTDAYFR